MWSVKIITTFPNFYTNIFNQSLYARGLKRNIWQYEIEDIRKYANDKHETIDDTPYGGGAGMILKPDVLSRAIDAFFSKCENIFLLSPRGQVMNQRYIEENICQNKVLNLICGRFEGIDERVIEKYSIKEISIGDFVLSNGDIAAVALIDSCLRFLPNFLGNKNVHQEESFGRGEYKNLLEYPHYTKPDNWQGKEVPKVLKSGNHKKIFEWRLDMAKKLTKIRRPDLWQKHIKQLTNE